ncbi:SusC/RagA family TonB-linked outer membrane protein [Olivibacter ginsenosidimutans]
MRTVRYFNQLRKRRWGLFALTLMALLQIHAKSFPQINQEIKVSIIENGVSLEQVFDQLEKLSGFTFLYKKMDVSGKTVQHLEAREKTLKEVLNELLLPLKLTYEVDDEVIIIRNREASSKGAGKAAQQFREVTGRVIDEEGQPLAGTTIYLKGQKQVAVRTGNDGKYVIQIPETVTSPILVFSYLGKETREIEVGTKLVLLVQLKPAINQLDEAVILSGYGLQQKRSDLVGSAYQIGGEQFKNLPAQRVDNLLEGLVPGLQIDYNTDAATSTRPRFNLRVRGTASMSASNEPLWIVDGIRVFTGDRTNMIPGMSTSISPLSYLNPDDIESITVLKDATMASLYGADGANGVILITTKKGRKGDPKLGVSVRYGLAKINEGTRFKVLDADQYLALAKEAYLNVPGNNDLTYFPYQDLPNNPYSTTSTQWDDVYYGTGTYLQNNLNVSGGTDKVDYYISGEYFKNQSTIKGNDQQRFSLRANLDMSLAKKLKMTLTMGASYNVNQLFNPGNDYYELLPIMSPYNTDGSYRLWYDIVEKTQDEDGNFVPSVHSYKFFNSVAERDQNDDMQRAFASVNNLILQYDVLEGLKLTSQVGADFQSLHGDVYHARTNWSGMDIYTGNPLGEAERRHANFLIWSAIERLNFNRHFGKHAVGGVAGMEISSQDNKSLAAYGSGFANDHIKEVSYAAVRDNATSSSSRVRRSSFFAQANYNYDSRYYLALNWRSDGNSDFGADTRWGNFWSAGASWNMHNEPFFSSNLIKVFKWKASFGTNGNSRLGDLQSMGVYTYGTSSNYLGTSGTVMQSVWNRKLSWERSYMANFGVRVNLNDRFDAELEVYNKKTVDLLSDLDVSRTTGDQRVMRNVGKTQNRGIEFSFQSTNVRHGKFLWTTDANISHNSNKLLEIYNGISKTRDTQIWMEGEDLNTFYLVKWAGVDPRDGAPLWYDVNGNLTRTYDLANRVPYKSASPLFTGGLANTFQYGNWSLNVLAVYRIGGYSFTSFGRNVSSDGLHLMETNQSVNQLDRWQNPGDLASSPKPLWQQSNANSTRNSTRYLYNTTYFRLKNVSVSYRLNPKLLRRTGLGDASVNLLIDNIGLWTPYDQAGQNSYKQAISGYPMETTVSLGLSVKI